MSSQHSYEFTPFRLIGEDRALFLHGHPVAIPPKELDTLLLLVENAGRIVGKQELLDKIWPDTFVEEGNLARHISYLRKRLSDASGKDDFIETIPKRGYRFRAPVKVVVNGGTPASEPIPVLREQTPRESIVGKRTYVMAALLAMVMLAVGAYYFTAKVRTQTTPKFRQLTFQRGNVFSARFAPDGQSIVYSAAWSGALKPDLYATQINALAPRPMQIQDAQFVAAASNGDLAIRLRGRPPDAPRGTLAIVPLAGGAPRKMLEDVWQFDWTPDGNSLAIIRFADQQWRLEYPIGKVLVASKTGSPDWIRFSRDGRSIAYVEHPSADDSSGFVSVTDLDGHTRRLTGEWGELNGLAWSGDGREIWFSGSESGANSKLYAVGLDGKVRNLFQMPGRLRLMDVSPGGKVLLTTENTRQQAYGYHLPDNKSVNLAWLDWTRGTGLSRDGQWAVFDESAEGVGREYGVFLRNMDGSQPVRIGSGWSGEISPDNKWVISGSLKQPSPTVLLPTGAGDPITLTDGFLDHARSTSFLPNAKGILTTAARHGENLRTYFVPLDGGPPHPVGPGAFRGTVASPDSALAAGWIGNRAVIVSLDQGRVIHDLPSIDVHEKIVQWSAGGHSLFLFVTNHRTANIFELNIDTHQRKLICAFAPPDSSGITLYRDARVDPSGQHFLFTVRNTLSDLFLLENVK
jgi:DNA-binding winged helix-turn-helix (wHTH) protein/Tol biopolymer transport system component